MSGAPCERRAAVKERDFLNWIIACAEQLQWKCWHVPAPMVANRKGGFVGAARGAGLCDLVMIHHDPPRMILAEVKGTGGKLSQKQQEFLQAAKAVAEECVTWDDDGQRFGSPSPIGVYAWTPEQMPLIEQVLKSRVLL